MLKDLLLIQMLFVVMYYIIDFMEIKKSIFINFVAYVSLVVTDIVVLFKMQMGDRYSEIYYSFVYFYAIVVIGIATWSFWKKQLSNYERGTYLYLYLIILFPAMGLVLSKARVIPGRIAMPAALAISGLLIHVLITRGRMIDTTQLLQTRFYNSSNIPTVIFNKEFYYLDANDIAKLVFKDRIKEMEINRTRYQAYSILEAWGKEGTENKLLEIDGKYYNGILTKYDFKGVTKGYTLQMLDVTEDKLEMELMETRKDEAEELAQMKSNFMATMSHDLRSPLHAIIAGSDILLDRNEMSPKSFIMVEHIKEAGLNLLQMVNSILEFSKLESGKVELKEEKYDLKNILMEQGNYAAINLGSKKIKFQTEIINSCPRYLIGDRLRVAEIIQNLLSNSVRFTDSGTITISIQSEYYSEDTVRITVAVADTGKGIKMDNIDDIFKEYVTNDSGGLQEGTGLGLSIVKQLAELMGGSASVESDGETGTKVTVSLLQKFLDDEYIDAYSIKNGVIVDNGRMPQISKAKWKYPGCKLLIADDMAVNIMIFKDLVSVYELDIVTVKNGEEAVKAVENEQFDLIVLDYMMPVMSGIEAADQIRVRCDTPMIALSADITDETKKKFIEHGFRDSIEKPLYFDYLDRIINKYLPEERRVAVADISVQLNSVGNIKRENYLNALTSYVSEVESIKNMLEDYLENDLDMFRTKVHGIKGVSRQLGRDRIGEYSEIFEMAVKAGHIEYIKKHMKRYMGDLEVVLDEAKRELENAKMESGLAKSIDHEREKILMENLKKGFEDFDIEVIESSLKELESLELSDAENRIFQGAKSAYANFDYEKGLELFG